MTAHEGRPWVKQLQLDLAMGAHWHRMLARARERWSFQHREWMQSGRVPLPETVTVADMDLDTVSNEIARSSAVASNLTPDEWARLTKLHHTLANRLEQVKTILDALPAEAAAQIEDAGALLLSPGLSEAREEEAMYAVLSWLRSFKPADRERVTRYLCLLTQSGSTIQGGKTTDGEAFCSLLRDAQHHPKATQQAG